MINILSYVGMNMQSEVCLWCLLGLVRTIFDATLFKVNANLKQVWQMMMPEELSMPVQRVLRTMVSGIMLVQCFTVYVYLASYIVLLYPVFLEERPTLVLPWLLLAAIRKLLCELTSLALGLGTCVLLGPARSPCIKFVVVKFTSIMPAFYMWMLVFSYYHALKVASAFKTFPAVLPPNDNDYGLELAVRRRRTKSLLGEEQLRKKLVAHFYGDRSSSICNETFLRPVMEVSSRMADSPETSSEEVGAETDANKPLSVSTTGWSEIGAYEDWFGSEVMIPRDTDRILEQIVLMLLRIGAFLKKEGIESIVDSQILNSAVPASCHAPERDNIDCAAMNGDDTDTPPLVGSNKGNMASYLREYPQIFMKKQSADIPQTECTLASLKTVHSHVESEEANTSKSRIKHATPDRSNENITLEVENIASKKKISITNNSTTQEEINDEQTLSRQSKSKPTAKVEGTKLKSKLKKPRDLESQSKDDENNNVATHIKISNKDNSNEIIQSTILNEDNTDKGITSIPKEDNNKKHNHIKISDKDQNGNLKFSSLSNENNDKEFTHTELPNVFKIKDSTDIKVSNDADTKVSTLDENSNTPKINYSTDKENLNEEFTQSEILDATKIKHSTPDKISNEDNNIKLMDAIPLGYLYDTLELNVSETTKHEIPTHSKTLNEVRSEVSKQSDEAKNKEFTHSQIPNVGYSQDSKNNNKLNQLNEDDNQDVCASCYNLNQNIEIEQDSMDAVNSETTQSSDASPSNPKSDKNRKMTE